MQKKVLLVDDESSIRRMLSLGLGQQGYDVEPCEDAISALKRLDTYKKHNVEPYSVVLDINLPDINGIRLGKIIRSQYPEISLFYITGYADKVNFEEMEGLNVKAILEKPFTSDDLASRFTEFMEPDRITSVETEKPVSVSSYALIKLNDKKNFFDTYRQLYYHPNVLYCDVTKGEYDIFMLIQGESKAACEKACKKIFTGTDGIEEITFLEVVVPILDESTQHVISIAENALSQESGKCIVQREPGKRVCSYLLLEVEREKLNSVYPVLRLSDNVVYCDYTRGKYNIVMLIHGSYYDELDRFIEEKVSNIDGVLKVKEYPIINLFEM
ncbi:MAG: response regulator [Bacteroidetes bacterium]|nr:response regulator [Bacteroidota bacterium]